MFKSFSKYFIKPLFFLFSLLLGIAVIRTLLIEKPKFPPSCNKTDTDFISLKRGLASRFSKALAFETVTYAPHSYNTEELLKFQQYLVKAFPRIHSSPLIKREVIAKLSLLYVVQGSDPSLQPYLITGHLDVVPAEPSRWSQPPFSGKIHEGFIYGRGTIDDKQIIMGVLEALEYHLEKNFKPKRTIYLAFGHDEEALGLDGAAAISKVLQSRGLKFEFLIDEGMAVMNRTFPGVDRPVVMIGVSEKGYMAIELTASGPPGHSSMPPANTPILALSKALSRMETNSHPNMFGYGPERKMFEDLAPFATFPYSLIYSNLWLFGSIFSWALSFVPVGNSFIRTTTAITIIKGGIKANVIPSSVTATINHRVHPAQTIEEVVNFDKYLINNPDIKMELTFSFDPLPMSPHSEKDFGYQTIKNTYLQIYPESAVVPTTMIGNTDTKWYLNFTNAIYRCSPINLLPEDAKRFHGDDERISLHNYEQVVNFYYHLILNADQAALPSSHSHHEL